MAKAGALSAPYNFNLFSKALISFFSLLAKALDSLHGVNPATSAMASLGATKGALPTTAARARAVAIFPAASPTVCSFSAEAEHTVLALTFFTNAETLVEAPNVLLEDTFKGATSPAGEIAATETVAMVAVVKSSLQRFTRWR
ncbi:hypothetical protein Mapa_003360 [Marchantia paleacea]|nr:hypothetical protein Mapa_003360 [Marchantia paleacea]